MKKIFSLPALFLAAAMAFTACDDDDTTVVVDPTANVLPIVSHETTFQAAAGTGKIVVDAAGPVTVTSNSKWLTASAEGNTITLNVEQNSALEGRAGTLTIEAGEKKSDISVIQSGVVFKISGPEVIYANDNARTVNYTVDSNLPVSFTASADYITLDYNESESTLAVKLTANNTGHMRQSAIKYQCGAVEGSIVVKQCEFDKDLAGVYNLVFYQNPDTEDVNNQPLAVPSQLVRSGSAYTLQIPALGLSIPVTYNSSDFSITVKAGNYTGDNGPYKTITIALTKLGSVYIGGVTMNAAFTNGLLSNGIRVTLGNFLDNGSLSSEGDEAIGIGIGACSAYPMSNPNEEYLGYMLRMFYPYLMRIDEVPAAAALAPAKVMGVREKEMPELKLHNDSGWKIKF